MSKTNRSGKAAVISKEELERFCSNLPIKYSLLAELLYFSSGRVREITTLKVRSINIKLGLLTLEKSATKTKKTRQVPIHPDTLQKLKSWIGEHSLKANDFVFFTSSKNTKFKAGEKALATQSVDRKFRQTWDWIGIVGASTHTFRRSRLNHLLKEGWDLTEIQHISGHASLTALQEYLESDKHQTFNKYRELFKKEAI